jgi:Plasmid pRiA4b ORF-3-like protein
VVKQQAKKRTAQKIGVDNKLYTFEVFIISGPLTEGFVKKNRVISRTIQIRGDQTLEQLHYAIFNAFDREEEHMYEFQMGGKGRWIQRRDGTRFISAMMITGLQGTWSGQLSDRWG